MNIFTANQVNQVYVGNVAATIFALTSETQFDNTIDAGAIAVGTTADGKSMFFLHNDGFGNVNRSDLIDLDKIERVTATPASAMAKSLLAAKLTLNTDALEDSAPIPGQDYVLKIALDNYIGISPEDSVYWKYGVVHATSSMSASTFYLQMASSIAKNMAREAKQLINVYVTYSTNSKTLITADSDVSDTSTFSQTYTGILIHEVAPDWILGTKQQKQVQFTLEPSTILHDGEEAVWGDVVYSNSKKLTGGYYPGISTVSSGAPDAAGTLVNSKLMADYEYFWHGERGDQYRMVGFPNYIPTNLRIDPNNANGYDTVGIHYSYIGSNESVQKSEKDITFILPRVSTDTTASSVGAAAAALMELINAIVNPTSEDDGEG